MLSKKDGRELMIRDDQVYPGGKVLALKDQGCTYEGYFGGFIDRDVQIVIKVRGEENRGMLLASDNTTIEVGSCKIRMVVEKGSDFILVQGEIYATSN